MKLRLIILLVFAHVSVSAQATLVPTKVTAANGRFAAAKAYRTL